MQTKAKLFSLYGKIFLRDSLFLSIWRTNKLVFVKNELSCIYLSNCSSLGACFDGRFINAKAARRRPEGTYIALWHSTTKNFIVIK